MDLKEGFDRALDGGPAHRAIEERLAIGRRAARRRRTAMGASALATSLVLGGIGWAALSSDSAKTAGGVSVATAPTTQESTETSEADPAEDMAILGGNFASAGKLELAPGAVIVHRIDNASTDPRAVASEAAIATFEGKTWWVMTATRKSGAGWTSAVEATEREFEQWVHEKNVYEARSDVAGDDQWGGLETGWVTLGDDGILTPRADVTILEQAVVPQTDDMPDGGPSATATIEVAGGVFCVYAEPAPAPGVPGNYYSSEAADPDCVEASVRPDHAMSSEAEGVAEPTCFTSRRGDSKAEPSAITESDLKEIHCADLPAMGDPLSSSEAP